MRKPGHQANKPFIYREAYTRALKLYRALYFSIIPNQHQPPATTQLALLFSHNKSAITTGYSQANINNCVAPEAPKVAHMKCWMELPAAPTARCLGVATSSLTLHGRRLLCLICLAARSADPWRPCSCWAGTSARIAHSGTQCQPSAYQNRD